MNNSPKSEISLLIKEEYFVSSGTVMRLSLILSYLKTIHVKQGKLVEPKVIKQGIYTSYRVLTVLMNKQDM